jgi:hypothetical protein
MLKEDRKRETTGQQKEMPSFRRRKKKKLAVANGNGSSIERNNKKLKCL